MPESRLNLYKQAILRNLHSPDTRPSSLSQSSVNDIASKQLSDLINGTVTRAEGNSCLLLGPRGSGKSRMVECCLNHLSVKPIVIRLCGWIQTTDRHALREIGLQLLQQTGASILTDPEPGASNSTLTGNEETNPFLDRSADLSTSTLPPTSHLHALIPVLLTLDRPIIVILDAFDLFALHPRQSLLYCLFDAVQNCRASSDNQGIAVIGITSRVDTIHLLEKRVKSRFSGRTIRTAPSCDLEQCLALVRAFLQPSIPIDEQTDIDEWNQVWASSVEEFLEDQKTLNIIRETFSVTRDMKALIRIMTGCVLHLKSTRPYLSSATLSASAELQRSRSSNLHLNRLSYPSMCLLIASVHVNTSGQPSFNFEMLFDIFRDQVRASSSAPVQVNGGSIGMAFQDLATAKIFISVMAPSNAAKEFTKYRCSVEREVIKKVIEKSAQTNLKKWLNKAP
ncbi:hypothetical protein M413DRAFT_16890 [Hebeloma cylindrosporum]|uniref:Uncharacterized protein n=1 Tax=Hebeloma cylindrosporum TaxID=76867 RepID=A0A0C3CBJ7_HEBCY|nr:hypothetical protein M413DRAFT_16890 [Hebeloma cylindrosporum h7]